MLQNLVFFNSDIWTVSAEQSRVVFADQKLNKNLNKLGFYSSFFLW